MKKILIVDPIESSVEKKKAVLSKPGFHLYSARTAEEALTILREDKIDMLISELDMPGMSGDELCSALRKDNILKNMSIIMIGFQGQESVDRTQSCGANSFLSKPLSPKELYSVVNDLLNIHGRENYRVLLKVTVKGISKDVSFFCTSQNLSVSGVLLETTKLLSKGDTIECSFFLRTNNITVNGEVVREEKKSPNTFHYGIKFLNMSADATSLIEGFVESRKKMAH
jgi:two-component system chemotaxis response regulator CheY